MFKTPVLFLIYNRPDVTHQVFEQIKKIKPIHLYIAADGPKEDVSSDGVLCEQTRSIIKTIDWDCNVKTLFRDDNLGCAKGVSGAISWFFEQEEKGIILEDDCFPDLTFFTFCEEMLNYYNENENVMAISGFNAQLGIKRTDKSYFFAKIPLVWGWATWREAWQKFKFDINKLDEHVFNDNSKKAWRNQIEATFDGKIDSWAFRWIYAFFKNNYTCIYPTVSLIKNLGVGENATHTSLERWWYKSVKYGKINSIQHPKAIKINHKADMLTTNVHMNFPLSLEDRMLKELYKFMN